MKKKSSSSVATVAILGFCSLIVILSYLMRTISISSTYGAVDVDIPVMAVPLRDTATQASSPSSGSVELAAKTLGTSRQTGRPTDSKEGGVMLGDHSPMVFLAENKAYFGRLTAFTQKLSATHNKFAFAAQSPEDFTRFAKTFVQWQGKVAGLSPGVVLIVPAKEVAMDKVIHMIAALKNRPEIDRVVLGGGLL